MKHSLLWKLKWHFILGNLGSTIDVVILTTSTPSANNQRQGAHGRWYLNEPRRIVFRIIESHPSVDDEGYVSKAARSINAVLILYPCPIRWSFRKIPSTWPTDPRSMPRADALSLCVLRFLSVSRDPSDRSTINGIRWAFHALFFECLNIPAACFGRIQRQNFVELTSTCVLSQIRPVDRCSVSPDVRCSGESGKARFSTEIP